MRDPKQEFVVTKITREQIVAALEWERRDDQSPNYEPDVPVADDDDRLTDELCQRYAKVWDDLRTDGPFQGEDWFFEEESALAKEILEAMGYTKLPEPKE